MIPTLGRFEALVRPPVAPASKPELAKPLPAAGRPAEAIAAPVDTDRMGLAAPPLGVGPLEDDDSDEDDVRTLMRPSLDEHVRAALGGPLSPHQSVLGQVFYPPPFQPNRPLEDDEDDIRTVMREAPNEIRALGQGPVPGAAQLRGASVDPLAMTAPGISPFDFPPPQQPHQQPMPAAGAFPPPQQPYGQAPQYGPGAGAPYGQPGFGQPAAPVHPGSYGPYGPYGQPAAPMTPFPRGPMSYRPPQSSGAGLAVLVAILALLVAAGATFLYLRLRANG